MDWIQQNIARRLLLAGALLLLPATLVVEAASGANGYTPVWLAASGIIVVLVILRMESALSGARHSEERFRIIFEDFACRHGDPRDGGADRPRQQHRPLDIPRR